MNIDSTETAGPHVVFAAVVGKEAGRVGVPGRPPSHTLVDPRDKPDRIAAFDWGSKTVLFV